jgi:hypothetical protein
MTAKGASAKKKSMTERALARRIEYWPAITDADLWHRKRNDGYATVPRTLPILMNIIDYLTNGKPAGPTYFALWCRNPDESVVTIESQEVLAEEAGFTGERKVTTWRARMKALVDLGFIDPRRGPSGDFHHVLIPNPHLVVRGLRKRYPEAMWQMLFERGSEIGASDLTVAPAPAVVPGKSAPTPTTLLRLRPRKVVASTT